MAEDIPEWAVGVALNRCRIHPSQGRFSEWLDRTYALAVKELAKMIAAHEEPPADPRIGEEALRLITEWGSSAGNVFIEACIRRGMELAQEQRS